MPGSEGKKRSRCQRIGRNISGFCREKVECVGSDPEKAEEERTLRKLEKGELTVMGHGT